MNPPREVRYREARSAEHNTQLNILATLRRLEDLVFGPTDPADDLAARYKDTVADLKKRQARQ